MNRDDIDPVPDKVSAGFACFHVEACRRKTSCGRRQIYVLLLRNNGGYWDFAKGCEEAADRGKQLETAYRELFEETGLTRSDVSLLEPSVSHDYEYKVGGKTKKVTLFLARLRERVYSRMASFQYDEAEIFTHRFVLLDNLPSYFFWEEDIGVAKKIQASVREIVKKSS